MTRQKVLLCGAASALLAAMVGGIGAAMAQPADGAMAPASIGPSPAVATATPIKHLVVIYDENISFDHYFATYPTATNPAGEPAFTAAADTPSVSNLVTARLMT